MLLERKVHPVPQSKRIFDLVLVIPGMLVLSPLVFVVCLLVWLNFGLPILFRQQRPGYRGIPFWIYKFRTMTESRDTNGILFPDEQRLTRLGKFLRATSLDELPELYNVLRGEMSLVGPRPLLMQYLERYTPEQARRHAVLPGITGWAQVNGRNTITWQEKFNLDIWYVDHWSLGLDIQILFRTLVNVLRREGINQPGQATSEEFLGNQEKGDLELGNQEKGNPELGNQEMGDFESGSPNV
ncbi:MAG TPA: sugar transferase [Anaerolineales bacterium]|nr:sugar transferase [Anaerolineales bacterium]